MLARSNPPAAQVTLLPVELNSLVWPKVCSCCGSTTSLDSIAIYVRTKSVGPYSAIEIPYCRRCQLHYRSAIQRALGTAAAVPAIGFTILAVLLSLGLLFDMFIGFFLQLLVVAIAIVLAVRTYLRARAEIRSGFTPGCSAAETPAVSVGHAYPAGLKFRFCSREYAERFATLNPGASFEHILL